MKTKLILLSLAGIITSPIVSQAGAYSTAVLNNSPFAYYRLDEANGSGTAADQKGTNPGTYINAPAKTPGAILSDPASTAFTFNSASSQYIRLGTLGTYGSSQANGFTAEYWLKDNDTTDFQMVMGVNNASSANAFVIDLNYGGVAGRVRMYDRDPNGNRYESNFYTSTAGNINVFNNAWHYIVEVYDPTAATSDRVRLYVDGVRQVNDYLPTGTPANENFEHPLSLGAWDDRGSEADYLKGSLDEVALYSTALSASAISGHYVAAGVPEPTVGWLALSGMLLFSASRRQRRGAARD